MTPSQDLERGLRVIAQSNVSNRIKCKWIRAALGEPEPQPKLDFSDEQREYQTKQEE